MAGAGSIDPASAGQSDFRTRVDALVAIGRALHAVGQPAHRTEQWLDEAAARLGLSLAAFSLPTGLILSIDGPSGPLTYAWRAPPSGAHLERLTRLSDLADDLIADRIPLRDVKP